MSIINRYKSMKFFYIKLLYLGSLFLKIMKIWYIKLMYK